MRRGLAARLDPELTRAGAFLLLAVLVAGSVLRLPGRRRALAHRAGLALSLHARIGDGQVHYAEGGALDSHGLRKEDGWWDASMRDRPVTVASAFMAAALLVIDTLV